MRTPSDPIELLNGHKTAIEKAVEQICKRNGSSYIVGNKQKRVLNQYIRLSKYLNNVVDRLCQVALRVQDILRFERFSSNYNLKGGILDGCRTQFWGNS